MLKRVVTKAKLTGPEIAEVEGTMLFELGGVTEQQAKLCFARLAHKMPVRVQMVKRRPA